MGDKAEKNTDRTVKTETTEVKDMPNSVQYSEEDIKRFMKITEEKEGGKE